MIMENADSDFHEIFYMDPMKVGLSSHNTPLGFLVNPEKGEGKRSLSLPLNHKLLAHFLDLETLGD